MVALVSRSHRRPLAIVCDNFCAETYADAIETPCIVRTVRVNPEGERFCDCCGCPLNGES